jgi:hypothetical protein
MSGGRIEDDCRDLVVDEITVLEVCDQDQRVDTRADQCAVRLRYAPHGASCPDRQAGTSTQLGDPNLTPGTDWHRLDFLVSGFSSRIFLDDLIAVLVPPPATQGPARSTSHVPSRAASKNHINSSTTTLQHWCLVKQACTCSGTRSDQSNVERGQGNNRRGECCRLEMVGMDRER